MQVGVLSLQFLESFQTAVRNTAGAGSRVSEDLQHDGPLAVQAGVAGVGVIDDFHIGHIGEPDIAEALHMEQQSALNILHAVVFLTDLQQPGLTVFVLHIARRHGEVLGVDELSQRLDVQLLCHVSACQCLGLAVLIELLGVFQLLFVVFQLLTGFRELHIGAELLAGIAAQSHGELVHQARHIIHGLDGIFQCFVNGVQAVGNFQLIGEVRGGAVAGAQTAL